MARLMLMWSQYGAIDDAVSHSRSIYLHIYRRKNRLEWPPRWTNPDTARPAPAPRSVRHCHLRPRLPTAGGGGGRDPVIPLKLTAPCSFLSVLQENICPILMLSPTLSFTHRLLQPRRGTALTPAARTEAAGPALQKRGRNKQFVVFWKQVEQRPALAFCCWSTLCRLKRLGLDTCKL